MIGEGDKMNEHDRVDNMLDAVAGVLIRCFVVGTVCLVIGITWIVAVPDWGWQMHSKLFHVSREQIALATYAGLILTKVGILGLFLLPYIGVKLVLKKRKREFGSD